MSLFSGPFGGYLALKHDLNLQQPAHQQNDAIFKLALDQQQQLFGMSLTIPQDLNHLEQLANQLEQLANQYQHYLNLQQPSYLKAEDYHKYEDRMKREEWKQSISQNWLNVMLDQEIGL